MGPLDNDDALELVGRLEVATWRRIKTALTRHDEVSALACLEIFRRLGGTTRDVTELEALRATHLDLFDRDTGHDWGPNRTARRRAIVALYDNLLARNAPRRGPLTRLVRHVRRALR